MRRHAVCATDNGIRRKRNHPINGFCALLRGTGALIITLGLANCSITAPITAFGDDEDIATGSLKSTPAPAFVDRLTPEDWRRARSALAVALDPEGNGSPVRWDNPETKTSGNFAANGPFVVKNNLICRPFTALLIIKSVQSTPHGLACRQGPGDWLIDEREGTPAGTAAIPLSSAPPAKSAPRRLSPAPALSDSRKIPRAGAIF